MNDAPKDGLWQRFLSNFPVDPKTGLRNYCPEDTWWGWIISRAYWVVAAVFLAIIFYQILYNRFGWIVAWIIELLN